MDTCSTKWTGFEPPAVSEFSTGTAGPAWWPRARVRWVASRFVVDLKSASQRVNAIEILHLRHRSIFPDHSCDAFCDVSQRDVSTTFVLVSLRRFCRQRRRRRRNFVWQLDRRLWDCLGCPQIRQNLVRLEIGRLDLSTTLSTDLDGRNCHSSCHNCLFSMSNLHQRRQCRRRRNLSLSNFVDYFCLGRVGLRWFGNPYFWFDWKSHLSEKEGLTCHCTARHLQTPRPLLKLFFFC